MTREVVEEAVETGISNRIQPWQALFGILTYALGVYGISDEKALILYGMIMVALGFTMVSSYKHKESIKQVVAPWLVEQLLKLVSEYLQPNTPVPPEETEPVEPVDEPDKESIITALEAQIKALEARTDGTSDSSRDA